MKNIMNVKMKLKMKMMVKVGDNVGIMSLKWFLWVVMSLKLFCEIGTGWFFAKKYIGASLYVEIKINWVEHFQEDIKFWIFEQIYGESKREPPVEDWKKCAVSWHFGIEAIGAQIGGKSLQV
jgi:hypothetical protein